MAIDVRYGNNEGRGFTTRRWVTRDNATIEMVSSALGVDVKGTVTRETDVETFKAQLNCAIQDWRTYRAKESKREHAGGS